MWQVVTDIGVQVFTGTKPMCKAYIRQALAKGSAPGFLRIEKKPKEGKR